MSFLDITRGDSPLILGLPHTGTELPSDCAGRLNETGLALADTDWHIHRLYDGLVEGATTVRTRIHRYVVDVNRDPDGASLYPGQNTTGLCPLTDFDGTPIYREGREPDAAEIARRREVYHAPYHAALEAEMRGSRKGTATPSSTIATPSGRASRSSSRARCPISTSAPITALPARRSLKPSRTNSLPVPPIGPS